MLSCKTILLKFLYEHPTYSNIVQAELKAKYFLYFGKLYTCK